MAYKQTVGIAMNNLKRPNTAKNVDIIFAQTAVNVVATCPLR